MTYAELLLLAEHYDEEKEYLGDGYFRLRQKGPLQYELAYLKADACGTTSVHPQITVEVVGKQVKAIGLMDLYATPVRTINVSEENRALIEEELTQLVTKFKQAKNLPLSH